MEGGKYFGRTMLNWYANSVFGTASSTNLAKSKLMSASLKERCRFLRYRRL